MNNMKDSKAPYEIIYEDDEIIVVYKKRNVLTIRTEDKKTFAYNLYHYLKMYLRKKGENLYIAHRLDYETSGLLVFPKTGVMKQKLQTCFKNRQVLREYECVVQEKLDIHQKFHVEQNLDISKGNVTETDDGGKLAITDIECMNYIQIGSACKVTISTGRKNQIRLAIASLGLTLLGDKRYSNNEAKRMYLNAYHLKFPEDLGLKRNDFYVDPLWIIES